MSAWHWERPGAPGGGFSNFQRHEINCSQALLEMTRDPRVQLCGMAHEWHYSTDPTIGDLIVEVQDSIWPLATFYRSPRGISMISTRGIRSLAR